MLRKNRRYPAFALLPALAGLLAAGPALAQVNGTIGVNQGRLQGTGPGGALLLNAPDPVQVGSSISHWDPSATPNLLMEPAINADLPFLGLDVTPAQMMDIGWGLGASNVNIVALDPPGLGFTDPTPFAGAPGNPATTLGEARVNLFNAVLGAWAGTLDSAVDIDVLVTWQPLFCQPGAGAVLGAASTTFVFRDHPAFPNPGVWYHAPLAEALAGEDLTGPPEEGGGDVIVFMNSALDEECLGAGTGWYYGLDGNNPNNQIDQAPVVLHEIGHGLGFANFSNEADGELLQGFPGIYDLFTYDATTGKTWDQMTDAERVASAINVRKVVWNGANATAAAANTLEPGVPELTITSPAAVAGSYEIGTASFGPPIPPGGLSGQIACMRDTTELGPGDTILNGCSPATNPAALAGKIALIDRGACAFTDKVLNAQAAGAIGAIIVNNAGNTPIGLGGDPGLPITIPTVSVGRRDGGPIREAACDEAAAYLNEGRFQVTATWQTPNGNTGVGKAVEVTDDSTLFYFFNPDNIELVVKVLNACETNSEHFWVFAGGLTNVEVNLTVVDTQTGQIQEYFNPQGQAFQPIQDTSAFATCP